MTRYLDLQAALLVMQTLSAAMVACWSMVSLSPRSSRFFSAGLVPASQPPPHTGAGSVIPPQIQGSAFPFTELHEVPVDALLQPVTAL